MRGHFGAAGLVRVKYQPGRVHGQPRRPSGGSGRPDRPDAARFIDANSTRYDLIDCGRVTRLVRAARSGITLSEVGNTWSQPMTSTMTSKGQVTVPKRLREYLGLEPGAEVGFELRLEGDVVVRPARRGRARQGRPGRFAKLRGTLKTGMTTDELMRLLRATTKTRRTRDFLDSGRHLHSVGHRPARPILAGLVVGPTRAGCEPGPSRDQPCDLCRVRRRLSEHRVRRGRAGRFRNTCERAAARGAILGRQGLPPVPGA